MALENNLLLASAGVFFKALGPRYLADSQLRFPSGGGLDKVKLPYGVALLLSYPLAFEGCTRSQWAKG